MKLRPLSSLALCLFAALLEGVWVLWRLASGASEPKSAVLLGYSLERLVLIGAALALCLLFGSLWISAWRGAGWAQRAASALRSSTWLLASAAALCLLGWTLTWLPGERWGRLQAAALRLQPFFIWLAVFGAQSLALILWQRRSDLHQRARALWQEDRLSVLASLVPLAVMMFTWGFIALTRLGVTPDFVTWGGAGAPLLALQMLILWLVGAALLWFRLPLRREKVGEILLCLALWLAASTAWLSLPFVDHYFAPAPLPPNFERYPYSDAYHYDLPAQTLLAGEGFNNRAAISRPLYSAFLAGLHALAGQNYDDVIRLQVLIFGIYAPLLYLLGKSLHSRRLGLLLALAGILREANTISGSAWLETSHSRLMMTDFPTAIFTLGGALLVIEWLKRPESGFRRALWAGGMIGLSLLLRFNTLLLVPAALGNALLVFGRRWRRWLGAAALFLLALAAATLPWMARNARYTGVFALDDLKLRLVIGTRYLVTPSPAPSVQAPTAAASPMPPASTPTTSPDPTRPAIPTPSPSPVAPASPPLWLAVLRFTSAHFLHNLATTALILPARFELSTLKSAIQSQPYFSETWLGDLPGETGLLLFANLVLTALGIGVIWRRWRWVGMAPLVFNLAYNLSNALARTSGWRYTLPVDWVYLFYHLTGLLTLTAWGFTLLGFQIDWLPARDDAEDSPAKHPLRRGIGQSALICLSFLVAGALVPLPEAVIQPRFPLQPRSALLEQVTVSPAFASSGLSVDQLKAFLSQPYATILRGSLLYTSYYRPYRGGGDPFVPYAYIQPYRRLGMLLVGRQTVTVILPLGEPPAPIPGSRAGIAIGCVYGGRMDALLVLVEESPPRLLQRYPSSPLRCPLDMPYEEPQ